MAIEEPAYQVLQQDGAISLREYSAVVVAETEVEGDFKEASNEGFRRLAGYIFGKNERAQEIAMTAPVGMSEKIAMTAPVGTTPTGGSSWRVTFTLPATYSLNTAPRPLDSRVVIREVPPQKIAVLRYSGTWSEKRFQAKAQQLLDWMAGRQIIPTAQATLARFNPPWTPWFWRRNEVWIPFAAR
ncbi:MAG: hypothetical protein RJB38_1595 [Pseudomonadota bacterium]